MSEFTDALEYQAVQGKVVKGRQIYRVTKSFSFYSGGRENPIFEVTIPSGFETDLASVPWPFSLVLKPTGRYAQAAVVHDYLLERHINHQHFVSKIVVDASFYEAMLVLKVNKIIASLFYYAVRLYSPIYFMRHS